ncbi:hypothetical protein VDBG_04949 [Verticillium alfalfae VaMs.102]|uniref:Uncharacterized protein n=1 Tax=Verticillium alfalfae (strain VaMs.102 / ATCC MYA-4576 / FGSC 10136) TaxID=526221 RepID=C9SIR7_VERA1|nr:hypothetical protein VDBG_04949 [Verticillium alfalfae VaMs.102]EEY18840.1 hypothetical protein VDBG_04949 [Verticillium alfalfae VaMs.102]
MAGADVDVPLTCSSRGEILSIQSEKVKVWKPWDSAEAEATDGAHPGEASFRILCSIAPQLAQSFGQPAGHKIQQSSSTWSMMRAVVRSAPGYVKKVDRCKISAVGPGTMYPQALVCWDNFGSWDVLDRAVDYDADDSAVFEVGAAWDARFQKTLGGDGAG